MSRPASQVAPWAALASVLPLALALLLLVETAHTTVVVGEIGLLRALGVLGVVATGGALQLGWPALIVLAQAGLAALLTPVRLRVVVVLLALMQVAIVRAALLEHQPLARHFWVTLGLVVAGAGYSLLMLWISAPDLAPRARRLCGAVVAVGSCVLAVVHPLQLVGLYPTLHTGAAMAAFLGVHAGLAMLLLGARPRRALLIPLVGLPLPVLLVALLTPASVRASMRPYVMAYSALARPALRSDLPEQLLRPTGADEPGGPEATLRPDADWSARFATHAALPELPADFDLADHDILFVITDAQRYDRTSLADAASDTTPALRGLAEGGALSFANALSPSNGTFPSLSSLFGMTYPSFAHMEIHAKHWHGRLAPRQRTAAEAFAKAGRSTFWVGHDLNGVFSREARGLDQGFAKRHLVVQRPGGDQDVDRRIADKAIAEVRARRRAGERYFGFVFFISPHDDYQAHDRARPAGTPLERYDQELRFADAQLGRLLEEVARDGGLEQTVVVVTSDHGEAFGEHGHRFHLSSLHAEQVHVPLVVRVPGLRRAAPVTPPTSNLYVLPWLMLRGPPEVRGAAEQVLRHEIGPMLRETDGAVVSEFISRERLEVTLRYRDFTVYYHMLPDFFRIYDARRDPQEQQDLRERRADLVERFTPVVRAYRGARFTGQRFHFAPQESPRLFGIF